MNHKIVENFFYLSISKIISSVLGFFLFVYLAKVLGVENFGKYEFSLAICTIFNLIATCGLDKIGTREIAKIGIIDKIKIQQFNNNIVSLRFFLSLISFIFLLVFVFFIPKSLDIKILIFLNGIAILISSFSLEWFFIGIEYMQIIGILNVIKQGLVLIFVYFFIKNSETLFLLPISTGGIFLICVCLYILFYLKKWHRLKISINFSVWKALIKESYPVFFSSIMILLYLKFDTIMLGFLKTEKEVGIYSAIYRIILFFIAFRTIAINTIFPQLSKYCKTSKDKLINIINFSQKISIMVVLPLGVSCTILANKIILLLYGHQYLQGTIVFQILIWDFVILGINFIFPQFIIAYNKQKIHMYVAIIGAVVNIILNFFFIPKYGIEGAAFATLIVDVIAFIIFYIQTKKIVNIKISQFIIVPLFCAILMGFCMFCFIQINVLLVIFFAGTIYTILLIMFRYIKKEDILLFLEIVLKRNNYEKADTDL